MRGGRAAVVTSAAPAARGRPPAARAGRAALATGTGRGSAALTMSAAGVVYSDVIRRRWRQPRFRGPLPGATATAEDVNPLCGDRVRLMLEVRDGAVAAARFLGDSCAICTAAADVLAEMVEGRSLAEAGKIAAADLLGALEADIRPTRMRCVTLPLTVLEEALAT